MYFPVSFWQNRAILLIVVLVYGTLGLSGPVQAQGDDIRPAPAQVEVVFLLDCSGSMWSLHREAKEAIFNVLQRIYNREPRPRLRAGLLVYGDPDEYLIFPLTNDLNAFQQTVQQAAANPWGGDEWPARFIHMASRDMDWSRGEDVQRLIWVVGNEPPGHRRGDPASDPALVIPRVVQNGFVVSVIDCNYGSYEYAIKHWRRMAELGKGSYIRLFQPGEMPDATRLGLTPFDTELEKLNAQFNATYVPYGKLGPVGWLKQIGDDEQARQQSVSTFVQRLQLKIRPEYDQSGWDLVDATRAQRYQIPDGPALNEVPKNLQLMSPAERVMYLQGLDRTRAALRLQIQKVAGLRQTWMLRFLLNHFLNRPFPTGLLPNNANENTLEENLNDAIEDEVARPDMEGRNGDVEQSNRERSLRTSTGAINNGYRPTPDTGGPDAPRGGDAPDNVRTRNGPLPPASPDAPLKTKEELAQEAALVDAVTSLAEVQLPLLTEIQKYDIQCGHDEGLQLLDKMTAEERLKVLWMLKVAPSLRRLIIEKKRTIKATRTPNGLASAPDEEDATIEVEVQMNEIEKLNTAQRKQLIAVGFNVKTETKYEHIPPGGAGVAVLSTAASGRLDWNHIEKLIALPLVHQVVLPQD